MAQLETPRPCPCALVVIQRSDRRTSSTLALCDHHTVGGLWSVLGGVQRPTQERDGRAGERIYSDTTHRRLMMAAWVALEDIHPNSGPLRWYPGSHKMGIWDYDELSIRGKLSNLVDLSAKYDSDVVYEFYEREVQATIDRLQLPSVVAVLKRGETFMWAHNLLHVGSAVNDNTKSRISQVTHYWLDGAEKYWTPRVSYLSKYRLRCSQPVCHPSLHTDCAAMGLEFFKQGHSMRVEHADEFNCV
mmetsp:Transcript_27420/g.62170  ORF Transcript_27420/g.62170 Transcript_27420/m.62170 type:complete len:245 (-) Transcript_27420:328-1062(-)